MKSERMKIKPKEEDEGETAVSSSNHGKQWQRGRLIGKGSFGSVFLATSKQPTSTCSVFPLVMAVKSAEVTVSTTLQNEKIAYDDMNRCDSFIKCFGEEVTTNKRGQMIYNLLLEFASGGTLARQIKKSGGKGLPENDVRRYTRSIITGLVHMHKRNYVHCDLKPQNILLVRNSTSTRFVAKIGDLGLAKRMTRTRKDPCARGTLLYMAPEAVLHKVQEPPADIWALGCLVVEMLTGKHPWEGNIADRRFLHLISKYELPKIPGKVSQEGKEFLKRCFVRSPELRFTAKMLLFLPFVADLEEDEDSAKHVGKTAGSKRQRISRCMTAGNGGDAPWTVIPTSIILGMQRAIDIGDNALATMLTLLFIIVILLML